ncbi:hypothetical protein KTT_41230 [Tengunoibacter tsumagoiensis]|uniref:Uncharacterized protein n=2 Tax=Tengunoibacter tsumagoiensis TaxID=2014871 RepID=A0A402A524_9CHLR|nr:hypothetical protein KTT_40690 [Tengunoibacter tsumagoiensis]GCE14264.1 hypothetical protein KTT_41230 [Tengunoibacter tsumagoiensis]
MGGIPTAWRDDGHTLIAPNGISITQGFRDWVLSHNWSSDDVPLSLEQHRDPVQAHAPNFGAGQIQCFVHSLLWWTPATGVIQESQLGAEIYALQSQLDAAHTQISSLQAQISSLQAQLSAQAINPKVVDAIKEIQEINVAAAAALADLEAK